MDSTENIQGRLSQIQFSANHSISWKTEPWEWSFLEQGARNKSFGWEMTPEDIDRACEREKEKPAVLGKVCYKANLYCSYSSISGEPWGAVWFCPQDESSGGREEDGYPPECLLGTLCMGFREKSCLNRSRGVGRYHQHFGTVLSKEVYHSINTCCEASPNHHVPGLKPRCCARQKQLLSHKGVIW